VGKKKGRGEGEADRRGPGVGVCEEKEKEAVMWAAAGWFGGPAGLAGPKGKKGLFFFFFFSFSNSFLNNFSFQIQTEFFQTFSQKFYKLFRNHTSNQKPCKPTDDAQTLVVSIFIKLCLIF
jgi:hypothetical protein